MYYTAGMYMCICTCIYLSAGLVVDTTSPLKSRSTDIDDEMSLSEINESIVKMRRSFPTKFQMIFSALFSPILQFNDWVDLVKRHNEQSVIDNRDADIHTTPDIEYSSDKDVSNALSAKSFIAFTDSTVNNVNTEDATTFESDAEKEQRNNSSSEGIEANEYQKGVNGRDEKVVGKRQDYNCDVSKATLNMLVEYFKHKTICGMKASKVRFGLGK